MSEIIAIPQMAQEWMSNTTTVQISRLHRQIRYSCNKIGIILISPEGCLSPCSYLICTQIHKQAFRNQFYFVQLLVPIIFDVSAYPRDGWLVVFIHAATFMMTLTL
jgi:hypothetical protein